MNVMTAQPPLPMAPEAGAVSIGQAVTLVQDDDGGRVFLRGELVYAWADGDATLRRLAAVHLVTIKAARVADVAAALQRRKPGDAIAIVFVDRGGMTKHARITLAEDPDVHVVPAESVGTLTAPQKAFRDRWLGAK